MYRPFVPQDLRALNLAALEMVDFVIIDENATPLENIAHHPAGLFRQGLRVRASGELHPKTQEEIDVVEGYGGEILFTPGDIVYSSSALIELAPPALSSRSC